MPNSWVSAFNIPIVLLNSMKSIISDKYAPYSFHIQGQAYSECIRLIHINYQL